jgi:phospholipase/carboxylesterase
MKRLLLIVQFVFSGALMAQEFPSVLTYSVHRHSRTVQKPAVLILLHGYGSNESDLFSLARELDPRLLIASIRGPWAAPRGGFCWSSLEFLANHQFRYDYAQAEESERKIARFISQLCIAYHADSTQVYLMGFSQGAIISLDYAFHCPDKVAGVLALSGKIIPESESSNLHVDKVAFFVGHGTQDNIIPYLEAVRLKGILDKRKVKDVTFRKYEATHTITNDELADIRSWLRSHVK